MYLAPRLHAERGINGDELQIKGAVPTSYGMDFIELSLDPALRGQPLSLRFQCEGEVARFSVQIWRLAPEDAQGPKPSIAAPQPVEILPTVNGVQVYAIPKVDLDAFDKLALTITRLDADETADPLGSYQVTLDSVGRVEGNEKTN